MNGDYHISVVAASRNDNHGGSLIYRMQHFVNGFVQQCQRHSLKAELILVEWNPPDNTPSLAEVLQFPSALGACAIRIIRVPAQVHQQFKHADSLPLFQMIAKNVGIRRALGRFVLATNIDILFSDAMIYWMRDQLETDKLYRADRLDVPSQLPDTQSIETLLEFCQKQYFRVNGKWGTTDRSWSLYRLRAFRRWALNPFKKSKKIGMHTNACGDFTLLSQENWALLKGYPEWEIFSWHLDSVFLYQAQQHGIIEVDLPVDLPIYHIEHSPGSGYSPEGKNILFDRLTAQGIGYLKDEQFFQIIQQMRQQTAPMLYNRDDWGLSNLSLEEIQVLELNHA